VASFVAFETVGRSKEEAMRRPTLAAVIPAAALFAAALAIGYGAGAGAAAKDEEKKEAPPAVGPGPEVERLKQLEGTWDAKISVPQPGAPAMESKGVQTARLGCGGLWLITDFKGEFMGMPFEGHGVEGYDSEKKKYVQVWVDPMSSSLDVMEGTYDEATKSFTFKGKGKNPETGQTMEYRMKTVIESRDKHVFAMEMAAPDGTTEAFKIEYTRKK
jgi:hypothetical protein